jgi:hypothetical protein
VNWFEYCGGPTPKIVSGLKAIWPDGKWSSWDHGRRFPAFGGEKKEDRMPILMTTTVWNEGHGAPYMKWDGKSPGPRGFRRGATWFVGNPSMVDEPKVAICGEARDQYPDSSRLLSFRFLNEQMLMKGQHGIDPFGVNYWPVKDARGRFTRGALSAWAQGPSHAFVALLAPGPDGPLATERFEALREGVQIAEAMLFLQRALDDKKIEGELADRVNQALDRRALALVAAWKACDAAHKEAAANKKPFRQEDVLLAEAAPGARERDAELYAVCGEVARATAGK